jgi:hypothetical protein
MNLREEILKEHSRRQCLKIAGWIGNDKKRFAKLVDIFLHDEYRVVQRSALIVSYVADKHPGLIARNIHLLVNRLYDKEIHIAVKRNVIRVLQFIPVPQDLEAKVMNLCFGYLSDPNEAIAVRVFSMSVLANLAKQYPDIKNELEAVIKSQFKESSGGLKVRARNVLKELAEINS